jgi:hypothetical protein
LSPCDPSFDYYIQIANGLGITISECLDTTLFAPVTILFFIDNLCSTIYKQSSPCSCQPYVLIFTGTNSLPLVQKYLEQNPNLDATNVLANIANLKVLVLIQDPVNGVYADIGVISTPMGTQIVVDTNTTSQQTLIFYEQFIASLLNSTPNLLTVILNDLSTGLISNQVGCCLQQLIKAIGCFPFSRALFAFLASRHFYINQSIQPFMFIGATNKFILNVQNFPGTLYIDQTTTVNLQSGCSPSCPLIYSSTTNRFFITTSCSVPFLQYYYTKLFEPGRADLAIFIQSISSFLFILDIGAITLPNGTTLSIVVNIASTGIFYYTSSIALNAGIKILLTILDKYLLYLIANGIPSGLVNALSTINGLLALLSGFATDDCSQTILTDLELFFNALIAFLTFPTITNLGIVIESLLTLLTQTDIIALYQEYKDLAATFPPATTIPSYLRTLQSEFACKNYSACEKLVIALLYYIDSFGLAPPPTNVNVLFLSGTSLIKSTTTTGTATTLSISSVPNIAGIVYDPNTDYLYTVSSSNANLYIFNATTGALLKTFALESETIDGFTTEYTVEYSSGIAGASTTSVSTSGIAQDFLVKISVTAKNLNSTKYFISEYTITSSLTITQGTPLYTPSIGLQINQAEVSYGLLALDTSRIVVAQINNNSGVINVFALGQTIPDLINLPAEAGQFFLNKNVFYAPLPSLNQYVYYNINKSATFPLTVDGTISLPFSPTAMINGKGQDSSSLYLLSSTGEVYTYDSTCNTLVSSFQSSLTSSDSPLFITTNETGFL